MAIPTHSSNCQTWFYQTICWHCGSVIHVLQCTCGSAVLFNDNRPSSDNYHTCSGGIGDSGYSGWEAIDTLRNEGMPINPEIMRMVFGKKPEKKNKSNLIRDIATCNPSQGHEIELILNLIEFNLNTRNSQKANGLSSIAREIEGIPKDQLNFNQITFLSNDGLSKQSFTALIAQKNVPNNIKSLVEQKAVFFVRLKGLKTWWLLETMEKI